jgi:hypothetical protein
MRGTRCKHPRIRIVEFGTATTSHVRYPDGWRHSSDFGDYDGTILAECYDCGMNRTYRRNTRPKWLEALMVEATVDEDDLMW